MSRSDIICAIAIMCFTSLCFGGLAAGATWSVVTAPQGSPWLSNSLAASFSIFAAAVFLWLSIGLWKNPDHDAVLGRY